MTKQTQLTRICTSCGIEKPLAAFLQISGKQGTNYGSVCSSCRTAERLAKPHPTAAEEGSTTETSDKRIGSKEKVFLEQEKKRYIKDLKELYVQEAKKREEVLTDEKEEKDLKKRLEKEHRKFYLDTKQNQGFLGQKKPLETETQIEQNAKKQLEQTKNLHLSQDKIEAQKLEELIKQELQITSLDFSMPYIAGQTNQLRFQTDTFLKFKSWLGSSSPVVKTLDLLYSKQNPSILSLRSSVTDNKNINRKDSIEEYINQRLDNPSSRRR